MFYGFVGKCLIVDFFGQGEFYLGYVLIVVEMGDILMIYVDRLLLVVVDLMLVIYFSCCGCGVVIYLDVYWI